MDDWHSLIREVPDFPRAGVAFKDITPLLADADVLEYGNDRLEVHADAVAPGARILLVDDVLATGGTLAATLALARQQGAFVVGASVLVEITALDGRARWDADLPLEAAVRY